MVSCLAPEYATEVQDLLLELPAQQLYETLKAQLTKRISASEQQRIQELLSTEELGDRTPSQMLQRIQQLLGDMAPRMDAALLRELFLQRLPANVRMVLTPSAGDLSIDQLAQLASPPSISATSTQQMVQVDPTTIQLTAQVMQLAERLDKLTTQMAKTINQLTHYRHQSRSRSPGGFYRGQSSSFSCNEPADGLSYYHQKFGDQATKCCPPCKRAGND